MPEAHTVTKEWTQRDSATFKCDCGDWELAETNAHTGYARAIQHILAAHEGNGGVFSTRDAF